MRNLVSAGDRSRIAHVLALPLPRKLRLVWALCRDPRVTHMVTLPLALVIAYVLLPVHILPRRVRVLRSIDNLLVAAVGLWLFVKLVPAELLDEHLDRVRGSHSG